VSKNEKIAIHWFRRDFRLEDNTSLQSASTSGMPVLGIFIFDTEILDKLSKNDARLTFIHQELEKIHQQFAAAGGGLFTFYGNPKDIWQKIISDFNIGAVFANEDYEPYARERDQWVGKFLDSLGIPFQLLKDQVIFGPGEILKDDGNPYTVYTPFSKKWLIKYEQNPSHLIPNFDLKALYQNKGYFHTLAEMGFETSDIKVRPYTLEVVPSYHKNRDFPGIKGTSDISVHLRFGTVGIRTIIKSLPSGDTTYLKELIWREFFMHILYHFPNSKNESFKKQYDRILWRNNETEFNAWCEGRTGYPMVDAGIRELNQTGYMHNRVRMVVASFLCKHLLIDWRWGERYFAKKLLDFELSSNVGNWQWAAGSGCDAAPYFRVFNPSIQLNKFDPKHHYIKKWLPDLNSLEYPKPIVEHSLARDRAIRTYKEGIS
jgi:deoxyribodipyrimidine photo-lyase